MTATTTEIGHVSVEALTAAVAERVARQLHAALAAGHRASLVVSGGRSPVPLFEQLSAVPLEWARVWITLADERWVSPGDDASNEALVRRHLLQGHARIAHFVGLKNTAATPADGTGRTWTALGAMPRPFDAVVLGMGEDGHFASLFPQSPGLAEALDTAQPPGCVAMLAPAPPRQRISLNLPALLDARLLLLPLSGERKGQVWTRAHEPGPAEELPVRALLHQRRVPLEVHRFP